MKSVATLILLAVALASFGCKSMTPGKVEAVQPFSDQPRAGNVYLLRGFIGIWSYGVDHLGARIREAGIRAHVYQEDQWSTLAETIIEKYKRTNGAEPLVLIGHSYGADDTLKIARRLEEHDVKIDLIITLDPVTPPQVPKNVRLCYNIYQPSALDGLPFFRGIALKSEDPTGANLQNVNIRAERRDLLEPDTDHFNIEKNKRIHAEVVSKCLEFCPERGVWAAGKAGASNGRAAAGPVRAPAGEASRLGSTGGGDVYRVP